MGKIIAEPACDLQISPCDDRHTQPPLAHRLNIELHLQSLFGLHVHTCTHWLRSRSPLPPPHLGSYSRALLVSRDRRNLFAQSRQSAQLFLQSSELELPQPLTRRRVTRWRAREWEGPNSDEGTYTVIYMYFVSLCNPLPPRNLYPH
jgi:hypothetical protein